MIYIIYSMDLYSCCRTLYNDGHATVPKLAEKLTLELVHHIEVNSYFVTVTVYCVFC